MLIAMVCVAALEARAQGSAVSGVPNAVQGFSQNRDKPIQIDAGSLEVRDKDKAQVDSERLASERRFYAELQGQEADMKSGGQGGMYKGKRKK